MFLRFCLFPPHRAEGGGGGGGAGAGGEGVVFVLFPRWDIGRIDFFVVIFMVMIGLFCDRMSQRIDGWMYQWMGSMDPIGCF